jgi:hypothetical protein
VNEALKRFAKAQVCGWLCLCAALTATLAFAQSPAPRDPPDFPDPKLEAAQLLPGAYYWTGTNWLAMEPLEWSANGIKKTGKSSVWTYRHPQARLQLNEAMPLFCYKLAEAAPGNAAPSSLQALVIAQLSPKKDHRELAIASGSGAFAFRAGSRKESAREITVTGVTANVFLIAPKEPLLPGEYVLGGSSLAISGYDFGIHSK